MASPYKKATHDLDTFVKAELSPERELCPRCGSRWVIPGTMAAKRYGVCPECHLRALAEAKREQAAALRAEREYHDARRQLQREASKQREEKE